METCFVDSDGWGDRIGWTIYLGGATKIVEIAEIERSANSK